MHRDLQARTLCYQLWALTKVTCSQWPMSQFICVADSQFLVRGEAGVPATGLPFWKVFI